MSDNKPSQEFWDVTDSFIHLANQHRARVGGPMTSAALLAAAARFNAFVVAETVKDVEGLKQEEAGATQFLVERYQKMLADHLADHIRNYDKYMS